MKTISKYILPHGDGPHDIYVPLGSTLVKVGYQQTGPKKYNIVLWFCEYDDMKYDQRCIFEIYQTGDDIDEEPYREYVDTINVVESGFELHLFQVKEGLFNPIRDSRPQFSLDAPDFKNLIDSGQWRHRV